MCRWNGHALALDGSSVDAAIAGYDLILDGTDNFETRMAVNAACVRAGKPLISGAIGRWTGQVGVFAGRPCYQCLVPEGPAGCGDLPGRGRGGRPRRA